MNSVSWLSDDLVVPFVVVKAVVGLVAFLFTMYNTAAIWRRPTLVVSQSRRERMYALLLAGFLICFSSSRQVTQLTDDNDPSGFTLGYEHFISILMCLVIIKAMWTTRREDIAAAPPA